MPHLANGVAREQKKQRLPPKQRPCTCFECANTWSIDRATKSFFRGQYLGITEWNQHRKHTLQAGIAEAHLADTAVGLVLPSMELPRPSDLFSLPFTDHLIQNSASQRDQSPGGRSSGNLLPEHTLEDSASEEMIGTADNDSLSEEMIGTANNDSASEEVIGTANNPLVFGRRLRRMRPWEESVDALTMRRLREIKLTLEKQGTDRAMSSPLVFAHPPSEYLVTGRLSYELNDEASVNTAIIGEEEWLNGMKQEVREMALTTSLTRCTAKVLLADIEAHLDALFDLRYKEWSLQHTAAVASSENAYESAVYASPSFASAEPIGLIIYIVLATLHILCGVSIQHCQFALLGIGMALSLALSGSPDAEAKQIIASIPQDFRTVLSILNLEPTHKAFVCCPKCFFTYDADEAYPERCTNRDFPDSDPCGRKLRKTTGKGNLFTGVETPTREFLYQDMKHYLARLYSRPDLEDHLDRDVLGPHPDQAPKKMSDIWDGTLLRKLQGPDKELFLKRPGTEGRLVFSLNVDGFNPLRTKAAGKQVSSCGMYMVCLNLPPSIRYKSENVYLVGVVPGPSEPSLHQINYLLRPLVDTLLELWHTGVYFSRTSRHLYGRRVRCALGPLVCDLPAARKVSGFGHFKCRHFCSECMQPQDEMDELNYKNWVRRNYEDHKAAAEAWKAAQSEKERKECFDKHGVRWSELLRLPYWDPTRFVVIDSMHCFYLRISQRHVRDVFGMDVSHSDGLGISFDRKSMPTDQTMDAARKTLQTGSPQQLKKLHRGVLEELCRESGLRFAGTHAKLLERLLQLRLDKGWLEGDSTAQSKDNEPIMQEAVKVDRSTTPVPPVASSIDPSAIDTAGPESATSTEATMTEEKEAHHMYETAAKTTILKRKKAFLILMCVLRLSSTSGPKRSHRDYEELNKENLINLIQESRKKDGLIGDDGKLFPKPKARKEEDKQRRHGDSKKVKLPPKTRVLGKETLAEVRRDMADLSLPTWISKAPPHPGETKWGKLYADQWRALLTVNLPTTLMRLWGHKPKDSRERQMLENFMHLVTAVKLANMRVITEAQILDYEHEMHQYLTTLLVLFPGTDISPYQHMALHFGDQLRRFGPTHAWRCFPFERYNYLLQQIPTNKHYGVMEKTMLKRFCMGQNLRAVFNEQQVPRELHPIIQKYEQTFNADVRGTLRSDNLSFDDAFEKQPESMSWNAKDTSPLTPDTKQLLQDWIHHREPESAQHRLPNRVFFRRIIVRLGQTFHTTKTSLADSNIIFRQPGSADLLAGSISSIFSLTRFQGQDKKQVTETFLVLQQYTPLNRQDASADPFRQFPLYGSRLFYKSFNVRPVLVHINDVICHFGMLPYQSEAIGRECIYSLPLLKA